MYGLAAEFSLKLLAPAMEKQYQKGFFHIIKCRKHNKRHKITITLNNLSTIIKRRTQTGHNYLQIYILPKKNNTSILYK
jgi:hypothetical protein